MLPSQLERFRKGLAPAVDFNYDKEALEDALLDALIKDGRPYGDFNKKVIKRFLEIAIPNYKPPHRQTNKSR